MYVGQMKNMFDEKDMYPYLHPEMFGRHMSDILCPSSVFTSGNGNILCVATLREAIDCGKPIHHPC